MKIAMPYKEGRVNEHFGSSKEFVVLEADQGAIKSKKILNNEKLHDHGGLAKMLASENIQVIITGGIGRPMIEALQSAGFKVITGASGEVEQVASEFLSGQLVSRPVRCNCSGHHGHGHGHGHHGHGHHHN